MGLCNVVSSELSNKSSKIGQPPIPQILHIETETEYETVWNITVIFSVLDSGTIMGMVMSENNVESQSGALRCTFVFNGC